MSAKRHLTWKELSMEFVAGIFFFIALILLGVFTIILTREEFFTPKISRDVLFQDVAGLIEGDNVLVNGVTIGRVSKILLEGDEVRVRLRLRQDLKLYNDCLIEVRYSSVLGGRHVGINLGTPDQGVLPPDAVLRGQTPPDLINEASKLVQTIKVEVEKIKDALEKEQIVSKISHFVDDVSVISADLRAGKGTLGKMLLDPGLYDRASTTLTSVSQAGDNLNGLLLDLRAGKGTLGKLATDDALYTEIKGTFTDLRGGKGTLGKLFTDDELYRQLQAIAGDFKNVSSQLASGESSLGRLIMDKGELYLSLKTTLDSAQEIATAVRDGKGTLGKLTMDSSLYEDTRKTILEVRGAVQDFREQAPVATFGSMVLGAF